MQGAPGWFTAATMVAVANDFTTVMNAKTSVAPIIRSAIGYRLYQPCFLVSVLDR